jgi:glycosyltransferase involved in cell wall biosynthesis
MSPPSVSIGLPVYNGERYLRVAVDSILNQTLRDWELIICDNASTDGTEAICRQYAAHDPRVRYFRHPSNIGASQNFRRAFELAHGRYFKWLAVDDYCAPTFLEQCKRTLDLSPETVLCATKVNLIDQDGEVIGPYADRQDMSQPRASDRMMARGQQDAMSNAVYGLIRSDVMSRTAVLGDYVGSDEVFLAEMSLYGRFVELPQYLLFRRLHPGAYSWESTSESFREFYAPSKKPGTRLAFQAWRYLDGYLRAVGRAPLPAGERLRLLGYVARMMWWQRAELAGEIFAAVREKARR